MLSPECPYCYEGEVVLQFGVFVCDVCHRQVKIRQL